MAEMRGRIVVGDDGLPDLAITLDAEPSGLRGYLAGVNDGPGGGVIETPSVQRERLESRHARERDDLRQRHRAEREALEVEMDGGR